MLFAGCLLEEVSTFPPPRYKYYKHKVAVYKYGGHDGECYYIEEEDMIIITVKTLKILGYLLCVSDYFADEVL